MVAGVENLELVEPEGSFYAFIRYGSDMPSVDVVARAAEEGLSSDSAALAYFSNGTRSLLSAPSDMHRRPTQSYTACDARISACTASLIETSATPAGMNR